MSTFVIDNSVAIQWFVPFGSRTDLENADRWLEMIANRDIEAYVPSIFQLEFVNVMQRLKRQKKLAGEIESALLHLEQIGINWLGNDIESSVYMRAINDLCEMHQLSAYDAAYLELAIRGQHGILTQDVDLRKAADRCGLRVSLGTPY